MKRISRSLVLALPLCLLLASSAPAGDTIPLVPTRSPAPEPDSQQASPDDQKPEVQKYECPKTPYINCMPPVQEIYKPMCTKEYLEWAKSHCPGFKVVY